MVKDVEVDFVSRAAGDRIISDDISLSRIYILCQKFRVQMYVGISILILKFSENLSSTPSSIILHVQYEALPGQNNFCGSNSEQIRSSAMWIRCEMDNVLYYTVLLYIGAQRTPFWYAIAYRKGLLASRH